MLERNEQILAQKVEDLETQISELRKQIITEQEFYNKMLFRGAQEGDLETITFALKLGANIQSSNEDGQTVLHRAIIHKHDEIAKILLKKAPNLFTKIDNHGLTPILLMRSQLENVLKFAAEPDNVELLALIATPIFIFAIGRRLKDIAISALNAGADLTGTDLAGRTAIHQAVIDCDIGIITFLLKKHAEKNIDIEIKDMHNETPYELARRLDKKVNIDGKEKKLEIYLSEQYGAYKYKFKAKQKLLITDSPNSFVSLMNNFTPIIEEAKKTQLKLN